MDILQGRKLLFVVNDAHFFCTHRLPLALGAIAAGMDVHLAAPHVHSWAPAGFDVAILAQHGITFHPVSITAEGTRPDREAAAALSLWRLYRRLRPDVVHHVTIKPVLYGGIVGRLFPRMAVVSAVSGLGHVFLARGTGATLRRRLVHLLYRLSLRRPRSVTIVQNADDAAALLGIRATAPGGFVTIRGSGVDLTAFQPSPAPEDGPPVVVLPARLLWEKGVGEFVEAARLLKQRGLAVRMVLAGATKEDHPRCIPPHRLREHEREGLVEWWGFRDDMADVFRTCHIVCLPSYREGLPRALIEAAAAGRPIVTTDVPGCREIVQDGDNGLLVPVRDATALANALQRLIEDRALREAMGARGRAIAEAGFSVESVVRQTLDAYRALCQTLPAPSSAAAGRRRPSKPVAAPRTGTELGLRR